MKLDKPDSVTLFRILRHDISDMVDAMAVDAQFENWSKYQAALDDIYDRNVQPARPLGYHSARIVTWQPLVKQRWIVRMFDRFCAFKRFCGHGYQISDAWYLAGKFN